MNHLIRAVLPLAVGSVVGLGAIAGLTASASAASPTATPTCRSLPAGQIPVSALEASYRTLTHLAANTPLVAAQPRRFGVCGSTHYAFDLFTVARGTKLNSPQQLAQAGHSPIWVQSGNGRWTDEGLTSLCKLAPASLINLWAVGVTCK